MTVFATQLEIVTAQVTSCLTATPSKIPNVSNTE